jgi:predicted HD superfamily hydrolase involved in NAD metabolism
MIDLTRNIENFLIEQFQGNENRLSHTYNVLKVALKLGRTYSEDTEKITYAALLHDVTKYYSYKENLDLASNILNKEELKKTPRACLHAYSAAVIARTKFNIEDPEVLNAISSHCTGRADMCLLEKIIFVADYIEESRDFVTDELRRLAYTDLDKAVYQIMINTREYLKKNKKPFSDATAEAIKKFETEEFND